MKDLGKWISGIVYVGQLGLDLVVPVLLCLAGAWFLRSHFGIGMWIYFVAFPVGLGAGGMTFWKFYTRTVMKGVKKKSKEERDIPTFSKHL